MDGASAGPLTLTRSNKQPKRSGLSTQELWHGEDRGLIICWEVGRELGEKDPELARKAQNGEFPVLLWKGGANKKLKTGEKYGTLQYLATWQGLRRDDLRIDTTQDVTLTCTKTGMKIIFTGDYKKYANP